MTGLAAKATVPAIPWRLTFDGALAIAILALLAWAIRVNDLRDRWHRQYLSEHAVVERLERESKAQQKEVTKTVDHYVKVTVPEVRERVRVIETAPLPGNCVTPREVIGADL